MPERTRSSSWSRLNRRDQTHRKGTGSTKPVPPFLAARISRDLSSHRTGHPRLGEEEGSTPWVTSDNLHSHKVSRSPSPRQKHSARSAFRMTTHCSPVSSRQLVNTQRRGRAALWRSVSG